MRDHALSRTREKSAEADIGETRCVVFFLLYSSFSSSTNNFYPLRLLCFFCHPTIHAVSDESDTDPIPVSMSTRIDTSVSFKTTSPSNIALDTRNCSRLEYYPKGIDRLTSLRELKFVKARVDGNDGKEFSVGDLENLDLLRGSLWLRLVGNKVDEEDAKRAKLHNKTHLNRLIIGSEVPRTVDREHVIEALNPPRRLEIERSIFELRLEEEKMVASISTLF